MPLNLSAFITFSQSTEIDGLHILFYIFAIIISGINYMILNLIKKWIKPKISDVNYKMTWHLIISDINISKIGLILSGIFDIILILKLIKSEIGLLFLIISIIISNLGLVRLTINIEKYE